MDRQQLRFPQAPLTAQDRESPATALVTLPTYATDEQIAQLLRLPERSWVVLPALRQPPELSLVHTR